MTIVAAKTRRTEYVVDADGVHWLPPFVSRMEGMARYAWFRKKMGHEGRTASADYWRELTSRYETLELVETI